MKQPSQEITKAIQYIILNGDKILGLIINALEMDYNTQWLFIFLSVEMK